MKTDPLKTQAAAWVQSLEKQRAGQTLMLYKVVKTQQATPTILSAEPQLQAAFVMHVVELYAKLGTSKGKKAKEWFRGNNVPGASGEIVRLLFRRELPFTDGMFCTMFNELSGMHFLTAVPFTAQLAQGLEKFARKNPLSTALRTRAKRYADVLAIRHVSKTEAQYWHEEWGFPRAGDLKIAARIDKLLTSRA